MSLEIRNLHKTFAGQVALESINLNIHEGEFVCLLGPSGCGKTTLLRIIAGLLEADSGHIVFQGQELAQLPTRERGLGIVFQSYSLFPHMTVAQNIGYGLRIRSVARQEIAKRVEELLEMVRLPGYGKRLPSELSGGQQQRVAIARALAVNPRLLLLDEPLSALDAKVRTELRTEIRDVQRRLGIPTIMVTHDQEEAMQMADRIVCMNHGKIEQTGTPSELYDMPNNRFVADFMGHSNLLSPQWLQSIAPHAMHTMPATDKPLLACLRPEKIILSETGGPQAQVIDTVFLGNLKRLTLQCAGQHLIAEVPSHTHFGTGDHLCLQISAHQFSWVPA